METSTLPAWLEQLRASYLSGGASMYLLHGNVGDIFPTGDAATPAEPLAEFLARKLFSSYDLVLHYDMGRGLRAFAGSDARRLTQMNSLLARYAGEGDLPRDPTQFFRLVDRLLSMLLTGGDTHKTKVAVFIDYAELICGSDDRGGANDFIVVNGKKIASLGPGSVIGELSLLDMGPRTATVVVETQAALVRQLQGTVESDQAQLKLAQLQRSFSEVRAPISGRLPRSRSPPHPNTTVSLPRSLHARAAANTAASPSGVCA